MLSGIRGKRIGESAWGVWAFAKGHQLRGYLLVNMANIEKQLLISPDAVTPLRRPADTFPLEACATLLAACDRKRDQIMVAAEWSARSFVDWQTDRRF